MSGESELGDGGGGGRVPSNFGGGGVSEGFRRETGVREGEKRGYRGKALSAKRRLMPGRVQSRRLEKSTMILPPGGSPDRQAKRRAPAGGRRVGHACQEERGRLRENRRWRGGKRGGRGSEGCGVQGNPQKSSKKL